MNSDRVFFSKTNTKYMNFSLLAGGEKCPSPGGRTRDDRRSTRGTTAVKLKVPERDYRRRSRNRNVDRTANGARPTLRAFHDVSGTHHGFEIVRRLRLSLDARPLVVLAHAWASSYKSEELSDYYWGVHADEAGFTLAEYEAEGGIGWEAGLRTSYYLTKSMRLALSANYERLQHSVALSPMVEDEHVLGYFAGVAWQF